MTRRPLAIERKGWATPSLGCRCPDVASLVRFLNFNPSICLQSLSQTLGTRTVKDVMTWGPITVKPETEIREAARLMHSN